MKTAVITDSTAYLPKQVRQTNHIHMVPLNVIFGEESYQEEIDIKADDFYDMVREGGKLPKTSQPAIGLMTKKLEELAKEYDAVVAIHLSSGISGTYQAMVTAGEMVENMEVYVFDSEISCHMQGYYALEASELAANGATPGQILSRLEEMKASMRAYFMVDDLSHLHRGGRLNGAQAFVGSLLQVKPVLHFVDKQIVPFEKIRTNKKAIKRILQLFDEDVRNGGNYRACIIHANRPAEAEQIKEELESSYDNVEMSVSYFGPVIGTHLGEGAIGLGWYRRS
ncbi:DegV family protein [Halobacillus sp. ACCC02827]|uniref:DegV family protein n=1 Tax=unclassified Halobacillus TaxID=2636472 RepID=UPI000781794F|nr:MULTISPECIES: DegV family protein [unclassified Halobacillus]WJE14924.1 DegV family protein [Halobacillus sp. ACCC02827]